MTYQDLSDGGVSVKTFFKAKRQAEFMDWFDSQVANKGKKDEVEYFD